MKIFIASPWETKTKLKISWRISSKKAWGVFFYRKRGEFTYWI